MSWHFSVALPTDPAPCHDAAAALRTVAATVEDAAGFLARQSALATDDFDGTAARGYRAASAALAADSTAVARDTRALAAALDDHAVRIAAVRRRLARVRDDAVRRGLAVTSDERVEWVPAPGTTLDAAYRELEARATSAHDEAQAAYADWRAALDAHATAPPPISAPTEPITLPPVWPEPFEPAEPPERPERAEPVTPPVWPAHPGDPGPAPPEPERPPSSGSSADPVVPVPGRRAPEPAADLEFAPLPLRWLPFRDPPAPYDRPTSTEGADP